MKILLDSHVFLWTQTRDPRLGSETKKQLEDRSSTILLSVASIWELGIKKALGKIEFEINEILDAAQRSDIAILRIDTAHAMAAVELPMHHRDPFDRMLIGQAIVEGARLLTHDPLLAKYGKVVQLI
jgi:PIN domain nuclease of toxin-antitoxin system